ncbi:hypothetical protein DXN04_06280 [Chitinophaga silvisoli]|uniref:Uncharacterized protein n=1 Tax=Chitinophaga silvisoli TaxID=2291814 RepID=A0A3E1P4A4_9BACT|nr:hypothetical protein DXN04_06280 [Chitinophaga silvisoli]
MALKLQAPVVYAKIVYLFFEKRRGKIIVQEGGFYLESNIELSTLLNTMTKGLQIVSESPSL